jgi:hypothetical protein
MKEIFLIFKSKGLLLFQIVAAFILPIQPLLLLVGGAILFDTTTGLIKAYKTKEKISSYKLSRVISKMLLYQLTLISVYSLDVFLVGEFVKSFISIGFFITKITAMFLVSIEVMSINENIKVIYGLNFFQLFKQMLGRVKEVKESIEDISKKN